MSGLAMCIHNSNIGSCRGRRIWGLVGSKPGSSFSDKILIEGWKPLVEYFVARLVSLSLHWESRRLREVATSVSLCPAVGVSARVTFIDFLEPPPNHISGL